MSRFLITGGAGFIGSNLAARLHSAMHEVVILDDLSSGYEHEILSEVEFIKGSITNDDDLKKCFETLPDYVIHLAALFANQNSVDHPELDLSVNGMGTIKVFDFCRKYNVKKVLYSSSSCVYGNSEVMHESMKTVATETPYSITKFLGEGYAKFWSEYHGLDIVIVRLFNVYGPGDYPGKYRSVIPNFVSAALQGEPLLITGTGFETRDFCYIDDVTSAICDLISFDTKPGEVFNIATGIATTIVDLANIINMHTHNQAGIIFKQERSWDNVKSRQGDISKIKSTIDYIPKIEVTQGLSKTCAWISKQLNSNR